MRLEFTGAIQKLNNSCLSGRAHHSMPKKMARKVHANVKYIPAGLPHSVSELKHLLGHE
jgi:hypothetical protein